MAFGFAGAASGANDELQRMLAERYKVGLMEQQEQARQEAAARAQQQLELQARQQQALEEQRRFDRARLTKQDETEASAKKNAQGTRTMLGDFLTQRTPGKALSDMERGSLEAMAVTDDIALPASLMAKPQRKVITTLGKRGEPISKAFTEDELAEGVPEYRAPVRGPQAAAPSPEWVKTKDGQIVKRVPLAGDMPYDKVGERSNAADPDEARAITQTALDQAKRLYDPTTKIAHKGIDAATGSWEMRGNWDQDAVDFNSIRDQLVAALALPNLGALKGPMSDKDILFVKQLATRLENRRLSRPETERAVSEAIQFLDSKLGGASGGDPADALLDELLGGN